ncbi:hypothetical protein LTR86_010074 [Recurvomyces mirabilis]|nr:hypothetical protein LTR86_010074 [Recurvomyces mirabilis]
MLAQARLFGKLRTPIAMADITQTATPPDEKQSLQVIFVLGPPGVGKGTICKGLAQDFGWYHFSVGDYLRELVNSTTSLSGAQCGGMRSDNVLAHLETNKLVPGKTIAAIVEHKVRDIQEQGCDRILIDGYPRQRESAELFDKTFGRPTKIVRFGCMKETAKARFTNRKRGADDGEGFEGRYAEFLVNNLVIEDHYGDLLQILSVNTDGEREETYVRVRAALSKLMSGMETR